jgi:hypothetical protein
MLDIARPPQVTHDLFVFHAKEDDEWVRGYLLDALGLPSERVKTQRDFTLGGFEPREFENAILTSRYTVLVFTPEFLDHQLAPFVESLATFASVEQRANRLIPLILRPCEPGLTIRSLISLDCTIEANWPNEISRLRRHILMPEPPPQPEWIECPYPGMVPFDASQSWQFHGRDNEIQDILTYLHHHRLLFVIGPSGSGKSSLVFAGVLPELARDTTFPRDYWTFSSMRPGALPSETFARIVDESLPPPTSANGNPLLARPAQKRLLLVIDQLEEMFTQASPEEQTRFVEHVKSLSQSDRFTAIVTVRADFYAQLMSSPLWHDIPSQRIDIAPLRGQALRTAIRAPAHAVGVEVDPVLVERLIADAASEPGSLPLIQETMRLLWNNRRRRLLTLSAYEELTRDGNSGLAVAVAIKADAAYSELTPEQKQIARRILLDLVQLGEGRPDTRRQRSVSALQRMIANHDDLNITLDHLAGNRLVIMDDSDSDGDGTVDLAHEVLITCWPLLEEWLNTDREDTVVYKRLRDNVSAWHDPDRFEDPSLLISGFRLREAHMYAERHPNEIAEDERKFLIASDVRELARQRARYFGQAAGGATGAATGYGLAVVLGFWSDGQQDITVLLLAFLAVFPVGQLVGLAIGLGLWLWRGRGVQQMILTALMGATVSSFAYPLLTIATSLASDNVGIRHVVTGAAFGAGIGLGVSASRDRGQRVFTTILGSILAATLASLIGGITWDPVVAIVGGIMIGALTGAGFYAAAVDDDEDGKTVGRWAWE